MSRRGRGLAFALALALAGALGAAGCAQEGKLVETPLPTLAVATDFNVIAHTDTTAFITVRIKILTHVHNPCESQHNVLELHRIDATPPIYQVIPVARYNADDACVLQPAVERDSVLTLILTALPFGRKVNNGLDVTSYVL